VGVAVSVTERRYTPSLRLPVTVAGPRQSFTAFPILPKARVLDEQFVTLARFRHLCRYDGETITSVPVLVKRGAGTLPGYLTVLSRFHDPKE